MPDTIPANGAKVTTPGRQFRRVLLVNPPMAAIGAEFMMEDVPLRLEYLAGYVRGHAEVEVLDLANGTGNLKTTMKKFQPDLVGISINYISTHVNGLKVAHQIRELSDAKIVVGGVQVTALADDFAKLPDIDYVVRAEGERTLLELVQGLPIAEIHGLSYLRGGAVVHNADRELIQDLDTIPFPDRSRRGRTYKLPFADLDGNAGTEYEMIITSRGCWGKCTFCTEPMMTGNTQRYRRPETVIAELQEIVKLHPGKRLRVHIADPNFGGNIRITRALCDALIEFRRTCPIEMHFFVSVRTSTIANHPDLAEKMVEAGIDYVFIGMESPKDSDLRKIAKKSETRERQEKAAKIMRGHGAEIMSNFLIGLPGQTEEDILFMVKYAKDLELADCYFSVMTPLPGTEVHREAVEKGMLLETDSTKYRLYDSALKHDVLSRAKIRELCVRANAKWYDDLMLPSERRRSLVTGKKRKLYEFANKFQVLVNFFSFIGSGASKEFSDLDPAMFVKDMPNPKLRAYTEEHPLETFLEMKRFLRILGPAKLQVTLHANSRPVTSWLAETTSKHVKYVAAIEGVPSEKATIEVNVGLDPGALTPKRMVEGILRDNPSFGSRLSLVRLAAAAGSEVAVCYAERAKESLKSKAMGLYWDLKEKAFGKPAAIVQPTSTAEYTITPAPKMTAGKKRPDGRIALPLVETEEEVEFATA